MNSIAWPERLRVGEWLAERASGELTSPQRSERLEPKVMDLLFLLAATPGEVVTRERIFAALWPGMVVGEDTLARTVSKLRRALGDDARAPVHIETLSKRGYRLIAAVSIVDPAPARDGAQAATTAHDMAPAAPPRPSDRRATHAARPRAAIIAIGLLALVATSAGWLRREAHSPPAVAEESVPNDLVARADDFYFQYSRADNDAAIELYRRVLDAHPDHAPALAGLANALVQQQMRWPAAGTREFTRLGDALAAGHLRAPAAARELARAQQLAERAVALAPDLAAAHKALGFTLSAQGRLDEAQSAYHAALALDHDAWGPMINLGDLLEIQGREREALPWFERAFDAMTRAYARETARVRPWQSALGLLIAERHRAQGEVAQSEAWYRRVLAQAPLHPDALAGLVRLLRESGDVTGADALCAEHAALALPPDACPAR